jgi:hypothetical protein
VQAFLQTFRVDIYRDNSGDIRTDDYIGDCRVVRRDVYRDDYKAS